jgi:NET1-associated nuclear protein 1 (U3 small nucleolar RNA-associated protein 17)
MSDETTPSIEYIDGPMLPHLLQSSTATNANASHAPTSLVPIITPPLVHTSQARDVADAQQYLLVPNSQRIIVRSAHHGKRVCTLVPEEGEQSIWAVTLVWLPLRGVDDNKNNNCNAEKDDEEGKGEWVVIAGCSDGTLQEWSVAKFLTTYNEGVTPRRIFQLKCSKTESVRMTHLSSPVVSNATLASALFDEKGGSPLYGLIKGADNNSKKNPSWVVSCLIPPFVENRHEIVVKPLVSTKVLKSTTPREEEVRLQKKHVCLKEGDSIFLLQAACRPSSSTGSTGSMDYVVDEEGSNCVSNADIFLVICASRGFVVYRECIKSLSSKHEDSHVHFKLPLKPFYQSKDLTTFSSIAISPDTKNLALGRASGHIEILDNVFDNITKFLKNQDNCQQQHPEIVTVRKSVHWHANPVRALAFLADSGRHKGNSGSIISGGEESVLVTWQLDRDFHRPSHFVSRVGQGGILYALCSVHSGKIFVFCSDNSVQCYHGSNYDRLWTEQGIASMVLHEDVKGEEEAHDLKKGGILMLRDPITGYLMLANLPGGKSDQQYVLILIS